MNYSRNPKCLECGEVLKISKLDKNRWVCSGCNTVYEDSDINNKKSIMDEIDKIVEKKQK